MTNAVSMTGGRPSPPQAPAAGVDRSKGAYKRDDARIGWIDYAKGLSILLVVQLNANVGLAQKLGYETWGNDLADFCVTFRMPLFFMVAGLFLARSLTKDWRTYLDGKLIHFAYFYLLWVTIKFIAKAPQISGGDPMVWLGEYAFAMVQPFSSFWFIYLLAIFFIVTRLLSFLPLAVLWVAAAALHVLHVETGSIIVDQFAARFVFFLTGAIVAESLFSMARLAAPRPLWSMLAVLAFFLINALVMIAGVLEAPGMTLALGLLGAFAMIAALASLAHAGRLRILGSCGAPSLAIYLAFFLPVAIARMIGFKVLGTSPLAADILALAVPVGGVIGALIIYWLAPRIGLSWLFERPEWARLARTRPGANRAATTSAPAGL